MVCGIKTFIDVCTQFVIFSPGIIQLSAFLLPIRWGCNVLTGVCLSVHRKGTPASGPMSIPMSFPGGTPASDPMSFPAGHTPTSCPMSFPGEGLPRSPSPVTVPIAAPAWKGGNHLVKSLIQVLFQVLLESTPVRAEGNPQAEERVLVMERAVCLLWFPHEDFLVYEDKIQTAIIYRDCHNHQFGIINIIMYFAVFCFAPLEDYISRLQSA